jgi:hypothetical protein
MDYRATIQKYMKEWVPKLFLQDWTITVAYDLHKDKKHDDCAACIQIGNNSPEYLDCRITFNAELIKSLTYTRKDVEKMVLHELLHLAFAHMIYRAKDSKAQKLAEETAIQRFVKTLTKLYKGVDF